MEAVAAQASFQPWLETLKNAYPSDAMNKDGAQSLLQIAVRSPATFATEIINCDRGKLAYIDPTTGLCVVTILAMMGNKVGLKKTLDRLTLDEAKACLNIADRYGWTAMHFTAVMLPGFLRYLAEKGGDLSNRTHMHGTPEDIGVLTGRIKHIPLAIIQAQFKHDDGKVELIAQMSTEQLAACIPKLLELRGLPFYETAEEVHTLWSKEPLAYRPDHADALKAAYETWKHNPPELYLSHVPDLPNQIGLYTPNELPAMTLVCTQGRNVETPRTVELPLVELQEHHDNGTLDKLRGFSYQIRGLGTCVNHGWPNLVSLKVDTDGASMLSYVNPMKVTANSQLLKNYGEFQDFWLEPVKLFKWQSITNFFKGGLATAFKTPKAALEKDLAGVVYNSLFESRALFPLSTPNALLKLHLEGVVHVKEWQAILQNPESCPNKDIAQLITDPLTQNSDHWLLQKLWCDVIVTLEQALMFQTPDIQKVVTKWLLEHVETLPPSKLTCAMLNITAAARYHQLSVDSSEKLLVSVSEELESYNWSKDKTHPFYQAYKIANRGVPSIKHIESYIAARIKSSPLDYPKPEPKATWLSELQKRYPKEDYKKDERLLLHFQIVRNLSAKGTEGLIKTIHDWSKTFPDRLSHISESGLNPILLCTMLDRSDVLQELLSALPEDRILECLSTPYKESGATALHYAMVTMPHMVSILLAYGADESQKNRQGATAHRIGELIGRIPVESPSRSRVIARLPNGQLTRLSELPDDQVSEVIPGLKTYRDLPLVKKQESIKELFANKEEEACVALTTFYDQWQKKPPLLRVQPRPEIDGVGVVTAEPIPANTMVATYGSETLPNLGKTLSLEELDRRIRSGAISMYATSIGDGHFVGGIGTRFNHGFPVLLKIAVLRKGATEEIFVNPLPLPAYTELLWDYSPSSHAFLQPVRLFSDVMLSFFAGSLRETIRKVGKEHLASVRLMTREEFAGAEELNTARLLFPLGTPPAVLKLHLSGLVPASDWLDAVNNPNQPHLNNLSEHIVSYNQTRKAYMGMLKVWCIVITNLQKALVKTDISIRIQIEKLLLDRNEIWASIHTLMAILKITVALDSGTLNQDNVGTWLQNLDKFMESYDWLNDPSHPFRKKG